jgi:hypothetical protein
MTARVLKLISAVIASLALLVPCAQASSNLDITQLNVAPSDTQAGGNPNFRFFMRFCDPGIPITITPGPGTPGAPLYQVVTSATTTLVGGIDATTPAFPDDTITVASTRDFSNSGVILIDSEQIAFTGKTPTSFTGVTRGVNSTTPAAHAGGAQIHLANHGVTIPMESRVLDPSAPTSSLNGIWQVQPLPTSDPNAPTTLNLMRRDGEAQANEIAFSPGSTARIQLGPQPGCSNVEHEALLRQFKLHLPPGFLGNPTALPACPQVLFNAGVCPANTVLGYSISEAPQTDAAATTPPLKVPSAIYNVATLGLEPARLGTRKFPSEPPGPFPVVITLDTTNDYGLNSALVDIPKNLGGPQAVVTEIDTVLCAKVPCAPTNEVDPSSVAPNPTAGSPIRPFFRNPTSCTPVTATLEASSYNVKQTITSLSAALDATATTIPVASTAGFPGSGTLSIDNEKIAYTGTTATSFTGVTRGVSGTTATTHASGAQIIFTEDQSQPDHYPDPDQGDSPLTSTFTPTGCDQVPFDATVSVQPTESTDAGAGSAQQVTINYNDNYVDDPIWQSALKDADVTLPAGMTLSPSGGNGLQSCTPQQFGVNAETGRQLNNDPVTCPAGAQIGTIKVHTPVLCGRAPPNFDTPLECNSSLPPTGELSGKVFFGPTSGPGRPTDANPWKLYLLIEGAGIRIKLVGNTTVSPDGQIRNVFLSQPQVPFDRFDLNINGGERAVLANPNDCDTHSGAVTLKGWSGAVKPSTPTVTPTTACAPVPFAPHVDSAGSNPEQAGANTVSSIVISRTDRQPDIKSLKLSLPVGAVGSLAAVPQCLAADARAGACPVDSKVGTVKTTVGTGNSLLTAAGSLYLAQPMEPDDAATLALVVPAKVGPIDLGQVVVINHVKLRPSDTGVDAITEEIPSSIQGVPLHVRKIEITVDREGFFINPTGCDTRTLTATFTATDGQVSSSTMGLHAIGCDALAFNPKLRLIAGAKGLTKTGAHPPLTAIVTQKSGEANIATAKVVLPDILRPNVPAFNKPGGLCSDAQFAVRACPALSHAGDARVLTPVLPFALQGPVYVVQETGSILPKLYVDLKGQGIEVVLRARNSFQGIRTVNTFDGLPDVPQSYFALTVFGGKNGILNAWSNLCSASARPFDTQFTGQNNKVVKAKPVLEIEGCTSASSAGASISSKTVKVSRKGIAKFKVKCNDKAKACKGRLSLSTGIGSKSFKIKTNKSGVVKLKVTKKGMKKLRKAKRLKTRATAKVGSKTSRKSVTLVAPKRKK